MMRYFKFENKINSFRLNVMNFVEHLPVLQFTICSIGWLFLFSYQLKLHQVGI